MSSIECARVFECRRRVHECRSRVIITLRRVHECRSRVFITLPRVFTTLQRESITLRRVLITLPRVHECRPRVVITLPRVLITLRRVSITLQPIETFRQKPQFPIPTRAINFLPIPPRHPNPPYQGGKFPILPLSKGELEGVMQDACISYQDVYTVALKGGSQRDDCRVR
jgi:hypothetical protein